VAVQEQAIPKGRSELALSLPRLASPVQEHQWRLLLPDGNRYRFRSGSLRPAPLPPSGRTVVTTAEMDAIPTSRDPWALLQKRPGVLTDRINVGGNESGQQSIYIGPGGRSNLRGRVVDEQGNPLPGVTVTINSGFTAVGVTDNQGFFTFVALPAGSYTLKAEMEGFSAKEYFNIHISDGETKNVEIPMSAAIEDLITVTGEPRPLDLRRKPESPAYYDFDAFEETAKGLQRGLVGGVKPLNVAIPEAGKVLLLTGILPPAEVAAELEVRAQKR
jgi:carboxypeptidase family protein